VLELFGLLIPATQFIGIVAGTVENARWTTAFSGAIPPLIGWAAASGHLNKEAAVLYAIVAVPSFHGDCMDVPRGLRPGWLLGIASWKGESPGCDSTNHIAAACFSRNQRRAISDTVRSRLLLRSNTAGARLPLVWPQIRA
jgi:hypothetical protein